MIPINSRGRNFSGPKKQCQLLNKLEAVKYQNLAKRGKKGQKKYVKIFRLETILILVFY
jgi:hypothetical protein